MSERLIGVADCGASTTTLTVMDLDGDPIGQTSFDTHIEDYTGSVQRIGDGLQFVCSGQGELVAVSVAVAAEVDPNDPEGTLTRSGALTPWVGRLFRRNVADALGLNREQVGVWNDVAAILLSQQYVNMKNGKEVDGMGGTLSSGYNAGRYYADGKVLTGEEGHEYHRPGQTCTCGQEGHVEAFITGKGVLLNHGMTMEEWLKDAQNRAQFIDDVTHATINLLERHERDGFKPEELRWTGGVALGQPVLMQRAAERTRAELGPSTPVIDTIKMGLRAGLHGSFIDARRRVLAA